MRTLAATLLAAVLAAPAPGYPRAPVVQLRAGMHLIRAELAIDDATRATGLMHRRSLATNAGMLFDFDAPGVHCMWMKNTLIPLSVAFLDETGAVINIEHMAPQTEDSHCAARPARFALEMTHGWFAAHGVGPGFRLSGVPGAVAPRAQPDKPGRQ